MNRKYYIKNKVCHSCLFCSKTIWGAKKKYCDRQCSLDARYEKYLARERVKLELGLPTVKESYTARKEYIEYLKKLEKISQVRWARDEFGALHVIPSTS